MKKHIMIILILLVIFIGMYINRKIEINDKNITVSEVEKIETYIQKIYMWKEITGEALPEFTDINDVNDLWIWEVVKKNLEHYGVTYEKIGEKAEELFGKKFNKKFPKEGSEYLVFDDEKNIYYPIGIGLDQEEDCFLLSGIKKSKGEYSVEIIEYLEEYSNINVDNKEFHENDIKIKNLKEDTIAIVKSNENERKIKELVKENMKKFNKKEIVLKINEKNELYVSSVVGK